MGVCCMLTTLQQLWVINWVFNSSVCIRSQDVTLTCVLPFQKWKAHSTQQTPTSWLSGMILCRWRGNSHTFNEDWTELFLLHFMVSQIMCSSINTARYMIYTKKKGKPPIVKSLPHTDKNLLLHMLRTHCQALLWKAADKQNTKWPITLYYWVWLGVAQQRPISCNSKWTASTSWPNEVVSAGLQERLVHKQISVVWQQVCPVHHIVNAKVSLISVTIQRQPNMGTVQLSMMPKRITPILTLISLNIIYHVWHKPAY